MIATLRAGTIADLGVAPGPAREAGVHVSTVIKQLCRALDPARFSGEITDWTRIEVGFTVEAWIEQAWQARRAHTFRPGAISKDGIIGSPDAVTFDGDDLIVDEIKCTWMSSKGCPDEKKFWHWLVQIKAYCHLLDTTRARLHAIFMNGDYKDHREPQYLSWDLQFHDGEIAENWAMLVNQATALRRDHEQQAGTTDVP